MPKKPFVKETLMNPRDILVAAIEASGHSVIGATDIQAPGYGEPDWVRHARAYLVKDRTASTDNAGRLTGLLVSTDDGVTWQSSSGIRVMFHAANESDDTLQDLLVNVTPEGVILDVLSQDTGEVAQSAALLIEDLVGMTH
jgi:hypothetical protein